MGMEYTPAEKARIVKAVRMVALWQAKLWDALGAVERRTGAEFNSDLYLIGELAGECCMPPSIYDISEERAWEAFEAHTMVTEDE